MSETPLPEESIFAQAVEIRNATERAAFLARACGGDHALRTAVEALVRADDRGGDLLDLPDEASVTIDQPGEGPGTTIGPYKLLQQIGEGGMGTVFMAQQTQPIQRKVALKIIKAGMDSRQVIARFEAERQALAVMDHPNIARVFDAGTTENGRPYFVMELVKGVPITKYCDEHRLMPRQRLELFLPVCQAIQHAHQKGIIHRDIKPSNVMVAPYDSKPVVKVIDFGIAKATGQQLTDKTLFTGFGSVVGTMEYMSPEQAELNNQDIDTRSDIYSLGVVLYELLTGTTPLSRARLKEAAFTEMLRMIREEEPPKPSTRLSESKESLPTISAQRQTEPAKLTKQVRGELDWIVMKALDKDRNRRYETANGLAMDLQRYLTDEAVQACPPSALYRFRKFTRRNKATLMTASVVVAALLVGIAVATSQAVVANRAAQDALAAEAVSRTERDKALAERQRADEEAAIAKAVNDFLQNDLLAEAAPERNARDKKVTVEEVLGRASARIAGKFEKQPRIEAAIRLTIGVAYRSLGSYSVAQPHLERSLELRRLELGDEHSHTLTSMNELASVYGYQGQYTKAQELLLKALEIGLRVVGEEHADTNPIMNNLAMMYHDQGRSDKAEELLVKALEIGQRVLGQEHAGTIVMMNNLANLYKWKSQIAKAESLYIRALEAMSRVLGDEHPNTLRVTENLAGLYMSQADGTKSEPLYLRVLEVRRRIQGEEHPDTLCSMRNLAAMYLLQGHLTKAEPLSLKVLEVGRRVWGEEHPETFETMIHVGDLYRTQRQFTKAEPLLVGGLEGCRRTRGEEHPSTLSAMTGLAAMYSKQGEYAKAEPLYFEVLEVSRRVNGNDHRNTHTNMSNLAALYWRMKKLDQAIALFEETVEIRSRSMGNDHPWTLNAKANLGINYRDAGRLEEAIPLLEEAYRKGAKVESVIQGGKDDGTSHYREDLILAYIRAGRTAEGMQLIRENLKTARATVPSNSAQLGAKLAANGLYLLQLQAWTDAEQILRECLVIRETLAPDEWTTFNTKSMLGGSLLGQKKYADAEPLLLAGYEGMTKREAKIPHAFKVRLIEALERLVQLYEATGKMEEAAKWRKRLETQPEAKKKL